MRPERQAALHAHLKVAGANDTPVLSGNSVPLSQITEDQVNNLSQAVLDFLRITDVDANVRLL
jgi:hypothetical protein